MSNRSTATLPRPSPPPPVLTKPEGRSMKLNNSPMSCGKYDKVVAELPALKERTERSKIPDELLATLTSRMFPYDRLGPPKITKTPKDFKVSGLRCTDAVWHHPVGRQKYRYFLDQPTSLTGAGRDISFLCDAMVSQRERIPLPPMADRGITTSQGIQKDMNPMDTLIPEEYHIVKSKGIKGLEFYDDKYTVLLEDDEKRLKVFPSMKPSGRLEAMQLMRVMDEMLDKAGVNQECTELTGLSQIQSLLELVRVEQNIYNIVFHELIRQVSVECAERGQLLAKLRQRYVALLDRIPRQLKGLHTETLAQRALDRRLTEEIICFKSSIGQLNTELYKMREHDEYVSKQGERAQEQLAKALEQSQKNSDMVGEYHDLYEMQRRRLEGQVARLTDERDLWSRVTYNLALKVIKLNNLQLVSRLHVSEQTWTKTSEHFTVFLTSKDSEDLARIMQLADQWKEQLMAFMQSLMEAEHQQCESIRAIQASIVKWQQFCNGNIKSPDVKFEKESEEELFADLRQWSSGLTEQCERYGGEDLLTGQETLSTLARLQEAWVEVGLQLFRRHPAPDGEPPQGQEAMRELGMAVAELHRQLGTRINGESGIHRQLMSLVGVMDFWANRLSVLSGRQEGLPHNDWLKLEKALGSWMQLADEVLQHIDSTQSESERVKQKPHVKIEIDDVFYTLRDFISTQVNFFDCENLRLCEEVNSLHTLLTRWMVDLLLIMVPDHCDDLEPPPPPGARSNALMVVSLQKLEEDAKSLSQKLDYFSKYITCSCQAIVEEEIQKSMAQDETENELYELNKLQRECCEWVEACRILLSDVKGSPVELQLSGKELPHSVTDISSTVASDDSLMCADVDVEAETPSQPSEEKEQKEQKEEEEAVRALQEEEEEEDEDGGAAEDMEDDIQVTHIMKLIGHDGNIMEQTLGDDTVQLDGTDDLVVCPHTPHALRAFDALATVGVLQQELLNVEARAQCAEERALRAEEALQAALEKLQDQERQLQGRPSLETKVSKKSSVAAAPKTVTTPEAKVVSQKPEPSPKQTKPTKKR